MLKLTECSPHEVGTDLQKCKRGFSASSRHNLLPHNFRNHSPPLITNVIMPYIVKNPHADDMMVGLCSTSTPNLPSKALLPLQIRDNTKPQEWFRLPLPPKTSIPDPEGAQYVEYHLHFGKEARGWRNLQNLARGRPLLPNLREVRVIINGGTIDRLTPARCRDFRMAAELIGIVDFRCERVEVVYLPHHRTGKRDRPDEPDDATFTRDELQDFVVRNVAKCASFGQGRVDLQVENEVWPGRRVVEGREEPMRTVYSRGYWL
jgi:hypothetical protein